MKKCSNNNALMKEVFTLTARYCTNDQVECIYFLPYIVDGEKIFSFTVVFDEYSKEIEDEFNELHNSYRNKTTEFGGKFLVNYDTSRHYGLALNPSEVRRVRDLLSSIIIFDPTGQYTENAHQFDKYKTVEPYDNTLDYMLVENKPKKNNK